MRVLRARLAQGASPVPKAPLAVAMAAHAAAGRLPLGGGGASRVQSRGAEDALTRTASLQAHAAEKRRERARSRQEEVLTQGFQKAAAGGPERPSAREGLKGARRRGAGGSRGIVHFLQPGR